MLTKRFFISWLLSSLLMFLLSYVWHGIFLTDLSRLSYPKALFLFFAAIVYLMIGFIVTKAMDFKVFDKHLKRKPVLRGLIAGACCGIAFFMIATVVGVSFSTGSKLENMILDITWQLIEQGMGGLVVGIVRLLIFEPSVDLQED